MAQRREVGCKVKDKRFQFQLNLNQQSSKNGGGAAPQTFYRFTYHGIVSPVKVYRLDGHINYLHSIYATSIIGRQRISTPVQFNRNTNVSAYCYNQLQYPPMTELLCEFNCKQFKCRVNGQMKTKTFICLLDRMQYFV